MEMSALVVMYGVEAVESEKYIVNMHEVTHSPCLGYQSAYRQDNVIK